MSEDIIGIDLINTHQQIFESFSLVIKKQTKTSDVWKKFGPLLRPGVVVTDKIHNYCSSAIHFFLLIFFFG